MDAVFDLLLLMIHLGPLRNDADLLFRAELAYEIVTATEDPKEREVLARIGWFESWYVDRVSRCEERGYPGNPSLGTFQITPEDPLERRQACGTLAEQTALALRYVRRSVNTCKKNSGAAKLNLYVSGRCDRGEAKARLRWGKP